MAMSCSPRAGRSAISASLWSLLALLGPVCCPAGSQLQSGGGALGASARVMFKIVIPQTLAFSVINGGDGKPALSVGVSVTDNPRHLVPVSLSRMPLIRCVADGAGHSTCTAATP